MAVKKMSRETFNRYMDLARKYKYIIAGVAAALLLLIVMISVFSHKSINANEYTRVTFSGMDGEGIATVTFDYNRFAQENPKADYNNYVWSLSKSSGLKNGDEVVLSWSDSKQKTATYKVSGLTHVAESLAELPEAALESLKNDFVSVMSEDSYTDVACEGVIFGRKTSSTNELRLVMSGYVRSQKVYEIYIVKNLTTNGETIAHDDGYSTYGDTIRLAHGRLIRGYLSQKELVYDYKTYEESFNYEHSADPLFDEEISESIGTVKILVDKLNIREEASLKGLILGTIDPERIYPVYEIVDSDGYKWYRIGDKKYIASKQDDWTDLTEK